MPEWNLASWDTWLMAAAAYVAIITLVRLMLAKRDALARELDQQIVAAQRKLAAEKQQAEKDRKREEAKRDQKPGRRAA
ncbi:MAG TPA: hypothetical protein VL096_07955 [Pirellulaceae bacterium]|nr:hypothetical protein [Pirellulaceae bacterium]